MRSSANSIKKNSVGVPIQTEPREGTTLRRYFDIAMTGAWFDIHDLPEKKRSGILRALRESYEMEITARRHPQAKLPFYKERQYRCTGRWDGADFLSVSDVEVAIEHTLKTEA